MTDGVRCFQGGQRTRPALDHTERRGPGVLVDDTRQGAGPGPVGARWVLLPSPRGQRSARDDTQLPVK